MIGHVILVVAYILHLRLIGLSYRYERDAKSAEIETRWRRIRRGAFIGIPLPMAAAFVAWWIEYAREMAVVLVMMEAIPIALVLIFILRIMIAVNHD